MLNPRPDDLIPCPIERLAALLPGMAPPAGVEPISMSLGEPRPGAPYIRLALVHEPATIAEALTRLCRVLN